MTKPSSIILERLLRSKDKSRETQYNEAREVLQEIVLFSLARSGFFKNSIFYGGTALRLAYGSRRFSEDLDFSSKQADLTFSFDEFLKRTVRELTDFGLVPEVSEKKAATNVKQAWIKESSLLAALPVKPAYPKGHLLKIKIEVDINPPEGAVFQQKLLTFPADHYVVSHDLPTLFAGKLHALLCRVYDKGRDWHDFIRYFALGTRPNLTYLRAALLQTGPYKDDLPENLSMEWISKTLAAKVSKLNIDKLKGDVRQFLIDEQELDLWSNKYFIEKARSLGKMEKGLGL